jgi:transposase
MQGLLLHGIVTSASVQDRDGGIQLLSTLFGMFPFLKKLFADSAYEGPIFHTALASILPCLKTEIVKRSDQIRGFVVLPKRWIIERTIGFDQPLPQTRQRLGKPQSQRPCFPKTCFHPPHAQKAMQFFRKVHYLAHAEMRRLRLI